MLSKAGDIFIHAGDFTYYGQEKSFRKFFDFLDKLPYRYKVVVSGNHEISLDNGCIAPNKLKAYLSKYPCTIPRG